jgi:peroxiredoxin
VLGVNVGERQDPEKKARDFVALHALTYPILMDLEGAAADAYGVRTLPTNAVVDREGVLRYLKTGYDQDEILKLIDASIR